MIKDIKDIKECPECGSSNINHIEKKLQVICKDCGLIYEPMDPKKEDKFEKVAGMKK